MKVFWAIVGFILTLSWWLFATAAALSGNYDQASFFGVVGTFIYIVFFVVDYDE